MTTVLGLTASRMLQIEAKCIIDGDVDANGHLILVQHDETQIDAGLVTGSPGPAGPQGPQGATGPSGAGGQFVTQPIGNGVSQTFVITHNYNTRAVNVNVYRTVSPFEQVQADIERTTLDTVTIRTLTVPASGEFTVVVATAGTPGAGPVWAGYTFTQSSAVNPWVILHNLNRHPSVTIVDSGGYVIEPDVHYDSLNQVTVTFAAVTSGVAYLN
jgi:hypothetical protein